MNRLNKPLYLLAATLLLFSCGGKEDEAAAPAGPQKPMVVEVVTIEPTDVAREISVPGTIIPNETVQLYSEVSGRVEAIRFKEGQLVQKGAVLVLVDTDVLRAQKQQQVVEFELAKKDEARKKALLDGKGISLEEYEKSASALAAVKAQIDLTNVQISKAAIRAPFTGRIGLRHISEGAFITTSTLITTLVQENPIKVEFAVSERYAMAVKTGQTITFKPENSRDSFAAQVYAYEPVIDEGTRMMTIRASLPNKGKLIPGSFVAVNYDLGMEANAFMVPAESVIPVLKGQKVLVVRGGKVEEVPVQIGMRTPDKVQVIGNLQKGDQVLVSGLLAVKPGMPVTTKPAQK
jgi:membrane fusion protein, multidrug efflux system